MGVDKFGDPNHFVSIGQGSQRFLSMQWVPHGVRARCDWKLPSPRSRRKGRRPCKARTGVPVRRHFSRCICYRIL